MTTHATDLQAVVERLEKLERQNRRLKQVALPTLLVSAIVFLIGATGGGGKRTAVANEFVLVNEEGKTRAALKIRPTGAPGYPGPVLELYNENGKLGASLGVGDHDVGSTLLLCDYNGTKRVTLAAAKIPTWLLLADRYGKERASIMVEAPSLMGNPKETPTVVRLFGKDNKVIWRAP